MADAALSGRATSYAYAHRGRFQDELRQFIRFPSISAQPKHASDVKRCARWLADHLRKIGLSNARVIATKGHPLVYADWLEATGRPTLLIYGHYDVQPPEPLNEWTSPPFEAAIRDGSIYGRGASDDKGQMFAHVKALESYLRTDRVLPVNVRCLFEGEEEIGSPNLFPFLERNGSKLASNIAVISDTTMRGPNQPAIHQALRGALYCELEVAGPAHDLHSGNFGGAIHNPLQALCEVVAALHDPAGRIAIPGFYDRVRRCSGEERARMAQAGPADAQILGQAETERGWGEQGYSLYERIGARPALTVNGIAGGYNGPGAKGVIPSRARAKLSFRLVPDQDPQEIDRLFRRQVARITPPTVRSAVRTLSSTQPAFIDGAHPALQAASRAYLAGFEHRPVLLRSGGTIPVVGTLVQRLQIPTVLMGFASPDDGLHGPNERFRLSSFFKGIGTAIRFLAELAARTPAGRLHDARQGEGRSGAWLTGEPAL